MTAASPAASAPIHQRRDRRAVVAVAVISAWAGVTLGDDATLTVAAAGAPGGGGSAGARRRPRPRRAQPPVAEARNRRLRGASRGLTVGARGPYAGGHGGGEGGAHG